MKKRLYGGTILIVLYIIMIIFLWVNSGSTAEYATYMRVVKHDALFVQVVDEDGQLWDVRRRDDTLELKKDDIVMVVMDLRFHPAMDVFMIGHSYIEDTLKKGD